jgi:hypothetical protein
MKYCVNTNEDFIREVFRRNWDYENPNWHNPYNTHFLAGNVGSNNKVIWSLLRAYDILPSVLQEKVMKTVDLINIKMQKTGACDRLRGGWFDVMKRQNTDNGNAEHMWHCNKVWWQQEAGILGYLIYHMKTGDEKLLSIARDGVAFWYTHFFDYTNGGVFDTVSADGHPINRWKGSWVKGAYHEIELARYLYIYLKALRNENVELYYQVETPTYILNSIPARIPGKEWNIVETNLCSCNIRKVTYELTTAGSK